MPEFIRNRTIRPSTRKRSSKNYRVDIKSIGPKDTLIVNINHESNTFHKSFKFLGKDITKKSSLGFRVIENDGNKIEIIWNSTQPIYGK